MKWFLFFLSGNQQNPTVSMSTDGAAFCKAKAATAFLSLGQDGEWEMGRMVDWTISPTSALSTFLRVGFALWTLVVSVGRRYAKRLSFNGASFSSLQRPNEKGAA